MNITHGSSSLGEGDRGSTDTILAPSVSGDIDWEGETALEDTMLESSLCKKRVSGYSYLMDLVSEYTFIKRDFKIFDLDASRPSNRSSVR